MLPTFVKTLKIDKEKRKSGKDLIEGEKRKIDLKITDNEGN